MEACTCISDLVRYIEFLREEEERLVEHAKSLTAAVVAAHADAEARNLEIYVGFRVPAKPLRFEQWVRTKISPT